MIFLEAELCQKMLENISILYIFLSLCTDLIVCTPSIRLFQVKIQR